MNRFKAIAIARIREARKTCPACGNQGTDCERCGFHQGRHH
jgi:hypothetical protein